MNMQARHGLEVTKDEMAATLQKIQPRAACGPGLASRCNRALGSNNLLENLANFRA
jgi:hypothetical protein